jgi:hypothetical protein
MEKLPTIFLEIDFEDMESGMSAISFVKKPATEIIWQLFNNLQIFEKQETQRIITGPVMLANTPIKRFSSTLGYYNVKFSEKTIFDMMKKYFKENKIHRVNENHNSKRKVDGVYMIESFIINDRTRSENFKDLPDGTWMATFFVEDEQYWNDVVMKGEFGGFSLEGMFSEKWEEELIEHTYSKIEEILNSEESDDLKEYKIKQLLNL